jgi:excisionase family DNA binding protein
MLSPELLAALDELIADRIADEVLRIATRSESPRWLTLEQASERLGCSPAAVRMRASRGRLQTRRHGRRVYVSAASVDELT